MLSRSNGKKISNGEGRVYRTARDNINCHMNENDKSLILK